jgi:putative transcriptional regulator
MTDGEVIEAALSDPDAQPMTPEELSRMRRLPDVKALRARLGMTQKQFAFNYRSAPRAIGCRDEPGRMPRH